MVPCLATSIYAWEYVLGVLTAVLVPSIIICIVCFVISIAGVMLGERLEDILGKKMAIIGGLVLILIGINIPANHLFL